MPVPIQQQPVSRRCHAKTKKTGEQCTKWAMHGLPTCREHGSSAPQARAKRARIIEQERIDNRVSRLVAASALPDEAPAASLRRLSTEGLALTAVLREHLTERGTVLDGNGEVSQVAAMYLAGIEKVSKMLAVLVDREHASQERAARIESADAQLLIQAITAAVHAPHVGLTPEQARAVLAELQRKLQVAA